jgi:DNA-binding NarL/FixJ family response regulator
VTGTSDADRPVRVLIADDQEVVRAGLRTILGAQEGIEVVGEAADGAEGIALARALRPDVCLFDIRMPGVDGLQATRELAGPGVADPMPVVVITTFDLDEYVYEALRAGARGFLMKNAGPVLLREAVLAAARGDALIDPNVTVRLIAAFAGSAGPAGSAGSAGSSAAPKPPSSPLTPREEQVLAAVARGLGNGDIGRELHLSLSTVKTHLASIMAKIGARNRVELAIWATETGRTTTPNRSAR